MNYVRYPAKNVTPVAPHAIINLARKNDNLHTEIVKQRQEFISEMIAQRESLNLEFEVKMAQKIDSINQSLQIFKTELSFKYRIKLFFKKLFGRWYSTEKKID
jgi:hypothetical protein